MQRKLKIGFLTPFSTIYPDMAVDLKDGIFCGIPEGLFHQIEFFPEYIRQGESAALRQAIEKLITFHRVDMITGLIGYRSLSSVVSMIERFKQVCLFADMGEYLPFIDFRSDFIYFNSLQLWQAEFALGHWAQKKFGGQGSVFMSLYESGYHMHSTFRAGVLSANNTSIEYAVAKQGHDQGRNIRNTITEYLQKFGKTPPSYIHTLFSGTQCHDFYHLFEASALSRNTPLVVAPHMASSEVLYGVSNLNLEFYSASLWSFDSNSSENQFFKSKYMFKIGKSPNMFSLLGYEIGTAIAQIFGPLLSHEIEQVQRILKEGFIKSPRGERNFYPDSKYATPKIDIEKIKIGHNAISRLVIDQGKALKYNHYIYEEIYRENVSGWNNIYLCV